MALENLDQSFYNFSIIQKHYAHLLVCIYSFMVGELIFSILCLLLVYDILIT